MAHTVQQAHDLIDAYRRAIALLAQAFAEVGSVPEHRAEYEASGCPGDTIQNAQAELMERQGLLRQWLAIHDREVAYP